MSEIIAVAHTLAQTLERLGIVYWIGGSMASAVHGVPRSTQDVDFVAELKEEQIDDLVAALESEFYIDGAAVRRAVRSRRSFNVNHTVIYHPFNIPRDQAHLYAYPLFHKVSATQQSHYGNAVKTVWHSE